MKKRQDGAVLPELIQETTEEPEIPNNWIDDMVGALTDGLVIHPSPWSADLPPWCREQLPFARLIHLMKCQKGLAKWDECTDLEAMIYMFPATLESPLSHDWAEIYVHLGYQVMHVQGLGGVKEFTKDMKPERDLTSDQVRELRGLKCWIQRKKVAARKTRSRELKKMEKAQAKENAREAIKVVEEHEQQFLF